MWLFKIFANDRKTLQRKVGTNNIQHERKYQQALQGEAKPKIPFPGNQQHGCREKQRQNYIGQNAAHRVGYRVFTLPYNIRQKHGGAIAGKTAPGTGHITVFGYKQKVDGKQHGAACQREPGAPNGLVYQFVQRTD